MSRNDAVCVSLCIFCHSRTTLSDFMTVPNFAFLQWQTLPSFILGFRQHSTDHPQRIRIADSNTAIIKSQYLYKIFNTLLRVTQHYIGYGEQSSLNYLLIEFHQQHFIYTKFVPKVNYYCNTFAIFSSQLPPFVDTLLVISGIARSPAKKKKTLT